MIHPDDTDDVPMTTEDEKAFGYCAWIYCHDHMRPHQTGWCSVPNSHKVALGVGTYEEAVEKCRLLELPIANG